MANEPKSGRYRQQLAAARARPPAEPAEAAGTPASETPGAESSAAEPPALRHTPVEAPADATASRDTPSDAGAAAANEAAERRRTERHRYPPPLVMTPAGPDGRPVPSRSRVVHGRDLSGYDVGFLHQGPLAEGVVFLTFSRRDEPPVCVRTHLCRVTPASPDGWFIAGGRFLERVDDREGADVRLDDARP